MRRPGVYKAIVKCTRGTAYQETCGNDCFNCMWKTITYTKVDEGRLRAHVRLCRRNLRSKRVRCCATCPFEEEIIDQYPEIESLFKAKREQLCGHKSISSPV